MLFKLRAYQQNIIDDNETGILLLHWSRQIGKTTTLAAWAIQRIMRKSGHTVTLLSNTVTNGMEFLKRASAYCNNLDEGLENFVFNREEIRYKHALGESRILVIAANPRTARGFSGDLILDEFAFYEHSEEVWAAVEPILSANPDFLCRIASTGNGRDNMFYKMTQDPKYRTVTITRTDAWKMGVPVLHPITRKEITPEEARELSEDKAEYDQNYECKFGDSHNALISGADIAAATDDSAGFICHNLWTYHDSLLLQQYLAPGIPFYVGIDVGRSQDRTVITTLQQVRELTYIRSILRLEKMSIPAQERVIAQIIDNPNCACVAIDSTGLGVSIYDFCHEKLGTNRVLGISFASTIHSIPNDPLSPKVKITDSMATHLSRLYMNRLIRHPIDNILVADLAQVHRTTTANGETRIEVSKSRYGGHADHFWSFALALEAFHRREAYANAGATEIISKTGTSSLYSACSETGGVEGKRHSNVFF